MVYEKVVVSVAGMELLETLARNQEELATTMAMGVETTHLINLKVGVILTTSQCVQWIHIHNERVRIHGNLMTNPIY